MKFISALPSTFIPLFVAIDIFVALGIFITLTQGMPRERVNEIIKDSILTALLVSGGFLAVGQAVFSVLGITSNDFKIGGGLVLLILAVLDLVGGESERRRPAGKLGVVPLGVPLIVGPAVLTTLIVLVDQYGLLATVAGLLLNLVIVWVAFRKAEAIVDIFGKGGMQAFSKIMGLLLTAIAVMMIRLGLEGILTGTP